jgi:hypothetical protein
VGLFGLVFLEVFSSPCLPDDFFLTRNEGEKFVKGAKWIQGGKNTPEEQKKRVRKAGPLLKQVLYSIVVVVGLFENRFIRKSLFKILQFNKIPQVK